MSQKTIVFPEITKIDIDLEIKRKAKTLSKEEGMIYVRCTYIPAGFTSTRIRIWPSTFLISRETGERVQLMHADNIGLYPQWLFIDSLDHHDFTLIFPRFKGLCKHFDLIEDIPEPGEFIVRNIIRNRSDCYKVTVK